MIFIEYGFKYFITKKEREREIKIKIKLKKMKLLREENNKK